MPKPVLLGMASIEKVAHPTYAFLAACADAMSILYGHASTGKIKLNGDNPCFLVNTKTLLEYKIDEVRIFGFPLFEDRDTPVGCVTFGISHGGDNGL